MPVIVLLWELSEDERELVRMWRLLGTVSEKYRRGVLGFVREFARISGCVRGWMRMNWLTRSLWVVWCTMLRSVTYRVLRGRR